MRIQILILGFRGFNGNARDTGKWPLNEGSSKISKTFRRITTVLKQTRNGSSITSPISRHLSRTARLVEGGRLRGVGSCVISYDTV